MAIDAASCYDPAPQDGVYYQGDILENVPVVFSPPGNKQWVVLRPGRTVTLEQAKRGMIPKVFKPSMENDIAAPWEEGQELVLAMATKRRVLVMTQTCDIDHRKRFQVAPVFGAEGTHADRKLDSLRAGEIRHEFYLPPDPPSMPESFADLAQTTSVHRSYFAEARLVARHTQSRICALQAKIAAYFGRPFGLNQRDVATKTAEYMCVTCFYAAATVRRMKFEVGMNFGECPGCGPRALWVVCPAVP